MLTNIPKPTEEDEEGKGDEIYLTHLGHKPPVMTKVHELCTHSLIKHP
jgi:hypothetical protein